MDPIRIVTNRTAVERAYWHVKSQIVSFERKPRDRVRTQEIAKELQLSRTPVREALARLEHEGLLAREGGWGYSVRGVDAKEVADLFSVRLSLEIQAIREVIPRISDHFLTGLDGLLKEQKRALNSNRVQEFRRYSREFHLLILAATQNRTLQGMLFSIGDRIRVIGAMIHGVRTNRANEVYAENKRIAQSLRARNEAEAVRAVEDHLVHAREIALSYMASKEVFDRSGRLSA